MKGRNEVLKWTTLFASAVILLSGLCLFLGWAYTQVQLTAAKQKGIYTSPEEGMRILISKGYRDIQKIEIVSSGPNSHQGYDPHVYYVIARVWAASRSDGSPVGNGYNDYDAPGSFFLHTKEGWVHVTEGAFPELIGFWMNIFHLAGPPPVDLN